MFISFPAITDEWNDVLDSTFAASIAIRVGRVNPRPIYGGPTLRSRDSPPRFVLAFVS